MRLLLLLAFLAFLPPAAAEEFHEPFEADIDNNGIPDFWARLSGPGYPRYNELTFPDPDRPHGGAASVRFRMHGGSAGLRSQRLLAIDPGLVCELSGRVRTAGFDRNVAWVGVEWCDRTGSVLRTDRTDPVGGTTGDWSRVELRFEQSEPEARFVRLICMVEGSDLSGEAWFDDLRWTERIGLDAPAPGHPGRVFVEGEAVRLLVRAPSLGRGEYRLRAKIVRFDGSELPAPPPESMLVAKDHTLEYAWSVPVRETGYFDLWLEVWQGEKQMADRRVPLGIVPKLRAAPVGGGEYGVVIDPFVPRLPILLRHLEGMGLGRAKLLLRNPREASWPVASDVDPVQQAMERLRALGIDPIGVVPAPNRVRLPTATEGVKTSGMAEVLSLPPAAWADDLVQLLQRTQSDVSRWQLGVDGDHTLQRDPRRPELLRRAAEAVARVTRYPVTGTSVDPRYDTDPGPLQFVSLALSGALVPAEVRETLASRLRGDNPWAVSYAIPEIPVADRYAGQRDQVVHLAETAVLARVAGARDYYFHPLTGVQTGLFDVAGDPTPAYFAVRTLSLVLGGTRLDPAPLTHDPSLESPVFDRAGQRVAALWLRGGAKPRAVKLCLGEEARVLDPTGRVLEVPAADLERTVTATAMPVFLVDLDGGLVRTQQGIGFRGRQVRLKSGRQRETLRLTNGFEDAIRNLEVQARPPAGARGWHLELLERRRGRLSPGEIWEIPVEVELPQNEGVSDHAAEVEVRFETDRREYRFQVQRRLELATDIELAMEAKLDAASRSWQVTLTVRNATDRAMDLKCYLFAEGRPLDPRLLPRLAPGAQETLRFTVSANAVRGKVLRAHVEEIRGAAFCNREMELE